jgi:hypothetical protein
MIKKFLKRFEKLENTYVDNLFPSPKNFKCTKRFERLEINDKKIEFSIIDKVAPEETIPEESRIKYYIFCSHCGKVIESTAKQCPYCLTAIETKYVSDYQGKTNLLKKCSCGAVNIKKRKNCWVCGKEFSDANEELAGKELENIITLNIDGKVYKSNDSDLPPRVSVLMARVRREGYSEKIINDWMQEINTKEELKSGEAETRLSQIGFDLLWRILALIAFIIFIFWQLRGCFNYATNR